MQYAFTEKSIQLDGIVDAWHKAAAESNFQNYFSAVSDDFVFLGTDPTERWAKTEFETFCKPYFEAGKGWNFTKIERNWNLSKDGKTAWFDEKINTWMKDCRGTGVLKKVKGKWKIAFYNLSVLIENDKIKSFIELRN